MNIPQWSSDGATILFTRLDADDQTSLWLVESQGGEPQQVVESIQSHNPGTASSPNSTGSGCSIGSVDSKQFL